MSNTFQPTQNQRDFARAFLQGLGAPTTTNNIDNVAAWEQMESQGAGEPHPGKTGGVWNPLNCVTANGVKESPTGDGGKFHGAGQGNISNYASLADGAVQTARWWNTNTHTGARNIVSALKYNSNRLQLQNAINTFYAGWGGGPVTLPGNDPNDTGQKSDFTGGGDPGQAVGINDPLSAVASAVPKWLLDRLGPLATRAFWIRVGEMALGGFLVVVGLIMLLKDIGAVPSVKTVVGAAKTAGAVAAL